jgi:hypothetical protein
MNSTGNGRGRDRFTRVVVPVEGSGADGMIARGSGIVAEPREDGEVSLYFEGNVHGAANLKTWADRVAHAYERATWRGRGYPTIAKGVYGPDDVIEVGVFEPGRGVTLASRAKAALVASWLEVDEEDLGRECTVTR